MVHRRKAQLERLQLLGTLDFDPAPNTTRGHSYLEFLRTRDRATLARMTLFLLQVLIRICSYWRPSPEIAEVYGVGFQTAPRMALLFLMEREINEGTWTALTNIHRQLFSKALKEGANIAALTEVLKSEDAADQELEARRTLYTVFEAVLTPAVQNGRLPRLNFNRPLENQYDHCWKEPPRVFLDSHSFLSFPV